MKHALFALLYISLTWLNAAESEIGDATSTKAIPTTGDLYEILNEAKTQGDKQKIETCYLKLAAALKPEIASTRYAVKTYLEFAQFYESEKKYPQAIQITTTLIEATRAYFKGDNSPRIASALHYRATLYQAAMDFPLAKQSYEEAIKIYTARKKPKYPAGLMDFTDPKDLKACLADYEKLQQLMKNTQLEDSE